MWVKVEGRVGRRRKADTQVRNTEGGFKADFKRHHQLINACRGDPGPGVEQHKHIKHASQKPPILTVSTRSRQTAVKPSHWSQRFDSLSCLSSLPEPQKQSTDRVWKTWQIHTKEKNTSPAWQWFLNHYIGQISILFSNLGGCTMRLATDKKKFRFKSSNSLSAWRLPSMQF